MNPTKILQEGEPNKNTTGGWTQQKYYRRENSTFDQFCRENKQIRIFDDPYQENLLFETVNYVINCTSDFISGKNTNIFVSWADLELIRRARRILSFIFSSTKWITNNKNYDDHNLSKFLARQANFCRKKNNSGHLKRRKSVLGYFALAHQTKCILAQKLP